MTGRRSAAQALVWLTLSVPLFVSTAGLAIAGVGATGAWLRLRLRPKGGSSGVSA